MAPTLSLICCRLDAFLVRLRWEDIYCLPRRMMDDVTPESFEDSSWLHSVRATLNTLPANYHEATRRVADLRQMFYSEVSKVMQPRLTSLLAELPQETRKDQQALAAWLNYSLHHELGITIRCPVTGRPSILVADPDGSENGGRFRLQVRADNGRYIRTGLGRRIESVELMQCPRWTASIPRLPNNSDGNESYAQRIGRRSGNTGQKERGQERD